MDNQTCTTAFLSFISSLLILLAGTCISGCKPSGETPDPLYRLMKETGVDFNNKISDTREFNIFSYRNFYNGGGCAIGDLNNDGLADLFFTANMGPNKLYLNNGNWTFRDESRSAGIEDAQQWSTGVTLADVNADGWLDIYVCNAGYQKGIKSNNKLYINKKNGQFSEEAKARGLDNDGYSTHASFLDYDKDGDLDCFILNNSFIPVNTLNYSNKRELRASDWPVPDFLKGGGAYLMQNQGNGQFTDVSAKAGIYGSLISFGLGVTVSDINGDSWPDIYISNDFFEKDYLYINQQNGSYKEQLEDWVQHTSLSSMGADIADVNNDGYPDIFTTDMLPGTDERLKETSSFDNIDVQNLKERQGFYHQFQHNTLQINNGAGKMKDAAMYAGVSATDWSWGGLLFDADNDGFNDLYVCNGITHDVTNQDFIDFFSDEVVQQMALTGQKEDIEKVLARMPSVPIPNGFFRNHGSLRFTDEGERWGTNIPSFSNGAAYGDLDNDGDLDLIVNNVNAPAFIFQNQQADTSAHFLSLRLQGLSPNTMAVGAIAKLYRGSEILIREQQPARGFQSSVDQRISFGLGKNTTIDSVLIIWPNRTQTLIKQPKHNQFLKILQTGKEASWAPALSMSRPPMLYATPVSGLPAHQEDNYIDFNYERNVPVMQSRQGPKNAAADLNGDGLMDLFLCGAAREAGGIYLQQKEGGFIQAPGGDWKRTAALEKVVSRFFDADGDGDEDLVIGHGGNFPPSGYNALPVLLYLNEGQGRFSAPPVTLAVADANVNALAPADADGDGDLDLFVGYLCQTGNYGIPGPNVLLMNNGKGGFEPLATKEFAALTMITDAVWGSFTRKGATELMVVGEMMEPQLFAYRNGQLKRLSTDLDGQKGLWQCSIAGDINKDGLTDLVLGNYGENFYLRPGKDAPIKLYIRDFDGNGTVDKVLTRFTDGKQKPVFMKRETTDNIPGLKKQNLRHADFARKGIEELFTPAQLTGATVLEANTAAHLSVISLGNGKFQIHSLPAEAQLSSLHSGLITDVDGDGQIDLLGGGNHFGFMPQFSRLDASYGLLLRYQNGKWAWIPEPRSGLNVRGCVKSILATGNGYLFFQNNGPAIRYTPGGKKL